MLFRYAAPDASKICEIESGQRGRRECVRTKKKVFLVFVDI
jgi:hypothetical protein